MIVLAQAASSKERGGFGPPFVYGNSITGGIINTIGDFLPIDPGIGI